MNYTLIRQGEARKAAILAYVDKHETGVKLMDIAHALHLKRGCVESATQELQTRGELVCIGVSFAARWVTRRHEKEAREFHAIAHPGRGKYVPAWAKSYDVQDLPIRQNTVKAHMVPSLPITGPVSVWSLAA